jgi:hypothetical protein
VLTITQLRRLIEISDPDDAILGIASDELFVCPPSCDIGFLRFVRMYEEKGP